MSGTDDALGHLQAAAKEMISAARSMLDAAEQLVDDPDTIGQLAGVLTSFARAAGGAMTGHGASGGDGDEGDDPVERIVIN